MLRKFWAPLALAVCGHLYSTTGAAAISHDPSLDWKTLETPHFQVHFDSRGERMARRVAAIAERVHDRLAPLIDWTPKDPVNLVIDGRQDVTNGFATFFPTDRFTIFLTPPDEINSLEDHDGWLELVIVHEYTHILHLGRANGAPAVLQNIFGRVGWLFPNALQPNWLIEGLATWHETDRVRGIGRGQSSYFDMLMRMEVANGVKPIRQVNQYIATWPGGQTPYLYGVAFHDFIAAEKGEDRIHRLVDQMSDNLVPFRINATAKSALGGDYRVLWPQFEKYLQNRHGLTLEAIRQEGVVAGEQITHDGYYGGAARAVPNGDLVYVRRDGRNETALMIRRADGTTRKLARINSGAHFAVHPQAGVLVAQPDLVRNSNLFFDLHHIDLGSGRCRRLTHSGRYRFATWSPDGTRIVAVRIDEDGQYSLHELDRHGKRLQILWSGEPDVILSQPDWSPDGSALAMAVWRPRSRWNLEQFRMADRKFESLTADSNIEAQPVYTPDGSALLFTSDHGGVYNLRRLTLATKAISTLTNVEGGAFHPTQAAGDGAIYYSGNHPKGFDLFRIDQPASRPLPAATRVTVSTPESAEPESQEGEVRGYSPWTSLRPRWWLPHVGVDSRRTEIGATTSGWDVLQRHIYYIDAAYDFRNEWFAGSVDYIYDRFDPVFKLHSSRYSSLFLDSNDDPLRVTTSDTFMAEVVLPVERWRRELTLRGAAYKVRDADGWLATGATPMPDRVDNVLGYAVTYDSTARYPFSISRSHGVQVNLSAETSDAIDRSNYSGEVYLFDGRAFIPLGLQNVLAIRATYGHGTGNPRPFILGGAQAAGTTPHPLETALIASPFNQREFALRGYDSGEAGLVGNRMYTASVEWRFPIKLVERGLMAPPIALHQVHGSVFVDMGEAWRDSRTPDGRHTGAGAELHAETFLFYDLGLHLRLGYAYGFANDGSSHVYLRLGSSF